MNQTILEWLERANTLRRQVDMLYVVDGFRVAILWDGLPISQDFHGATLELALDAAMHGFDLDAPPCFVDGRRIATDDVEIQLEALEKYFQLLKERHAALVKEVRNFASSWLLDEREDPDICFDARHHSDIENLFKELEASESWVK